MVLSGYEIYCAAQPPAGADYYPRDWRDELVDGVQVWRIDTGGGQRGWMAHWPGGRGAVTMGADSQWGEWDADPGQRPDEALLTLDYDPEVRLGADGRPA